MVRALFRNCWHLTWRSDHIPSLLTSLACFPIEIGIKSLNFSMAYSDPSLPTNLIFLLSPCFTGLKPCAGLFLYLKHPELFLLPALLHFSPVLTQNALFSERPFSLGHASKITSSCWPSNSPSPLLISFRGIRTISFVLFWSVSSMISSKG